MAKFLKFFMALTMVITACGGDESQVIGTVEKAAIIVIIQSALDVENNGNASDIKVSLQTPPSFSEISSLIVVLSRVDRSSSVQLEEVINLSDENSYAIVNGSLSDIRLPETLTDIDGNAIENGQSYLVYVVAKVDEENENFLSGISESVEVSLEINDLVATIASGFSGSGGVLVGDDGSIYVADFGTGAQNGTQILKFASDGSSSEVFADGLLGPTGGRFDSQGNLFWSSYSASKIHKIDATGNVSDFASIPGPVAIAIDEDDNLFVASCDGNMISKVSPAGDVSTFATSTSFNCINGLGFGPAGNLYACNYDDGAIFKISPSGIVSSFASIPSGSSDNIAIRGNTIYVTGRSAHRIYEISISNASVNVLAGTGARGGANGAALTASFSFPNGIAFSLDGSKIYINDVAVNSGTNVNGVNFNPNTLRVINLE